MQIRRSALVLVLSTVAGVIGAVPIAAPAGATTSVSLTKDIAVAAPPSGNFAGAGSGDGWDVSFYGDRIFNVFHHGSQYIVDCHLQTDGSHCDTVATISPWPKTVSSTDPSSDFTTPAHASGWMDIATGRFYGWTSRVSDGTGGVICVDVTSSAANPFCGFTPLTDPGANPEGYTTTFGGRAVIGDQLLTFDPDIARVLCFSTTTDAPCVGQPFTVDSGAIIPLLDGSSSDLGTLASGGKLFIHAEDDAYSGGVITCFDPQSGTTCTGTWPQSVSVGSANLGAPFPFLSTTGTATGVCLPDGVTDPCWDLSGAAITTPAALIAAIGTTDMWNEGTSLGTRVFVPTGEFQPGYSDGVYCYDFATESACANFPIQTDGDTYLYSVTPDPTRFGCMWINSDSSGVYSQIRTFDAFDGSSGCAGHVHVTSDVVIPDSGCTALGWSQLAVLDPPPTDYTSATVTLTGSDGTPVPGGSNMAVDGQGLVDLSGLAIPDSVLFTVSFTDPTFSGSGVIIRFTWSSTNSDTCVANATRVPASPTITSVTPDSSNGSLNVVFTPPTDPGTSPITNYKYSTDGGVTWRDRTDGGGATGPIVITRSSSDGTSLVDGVSYDVVIRAVNAVGTGLASNTVTTVAVVPELLHAPPSVAGTASTVVPVSPVYIAGFSADVTVDISTTIGSLDVVDNAGLTSSPCSSCSGPSISFGGPQDAVNVALATLTATAPANATNGTITVNVTKSGDLSPSQTALIDFTVTLPRLTTPFAPTPVATSASSVTVLYAPVANASSYTVRVYLSDGTTLVGVPHPNFVSGDAIAGLDPSTTYKFSVTAIGDGVTFDDSLESPKAPATTLDVTAGPCGVPRPSQEILNGTGAVYASNNAGSLSIVPVFDAPHATLKKPIIDAVATASGHGSWSLASDGGVFTAGDAPFGGSLAATRLNSPVTAIVGTPCGQGYDILATDGGVFTFGDAHFYGSMGSVKLNQPMAGIAITCSGLGYYTVAQDGGVFTFGDAQFHGSMANLKLVSPIFAIIPNCTNTGYWMVARDGGVFTSGDLAFYGSLGGQPLSSPIVGLIPTPTFHGYWLIAANGNTYPFGDAH